MNPVVWFLGKAQSYLSIKKEIRQMKWIDFEIGGALSKAAYEGIFDRKVENRDYVAVRKNIALLPIPDTFDEYMRGKTKQALRTNASKAVKKGYFCSYFNGLDYIDDIMEINLSSEIRGGRKMEEPYSNRGMVREFLSASPVMFGTFTSEGKLAGYIHVLITGTMLATNKILGHADYLDDGVMYFMVAELVKKKIEEKSNVTHVMYASYLSGRSHAGYTYFKRKCGFEGYNVRFHLHYGDAREGKLR